jgi:hypothetical protein
MAKPTNRSKIVTIRFSPENLAAAEIVASLTKRSVSMLTEYALELFLKKNYPAAYSPGVKLTLSLAEAPQGNPTESTT